LSVSVCCVLGGWEVGGCLCLSVGGWVGGRWEGVCVCLLWVGWVGGGGCLCLSVGGWVLVFVCVHYDVVAGGGLRHIVAVSAPFP
jgi:hypothetical protein